MTKLSDADWKTLSKLNGEINDIEHDIRRLETRLENLRTQHAQLKARQLQLNSYGKLIPDVIRDWWAK